MYEVAVVRGAGKGKVMWSGPEIIVMIALGMKKSMQYVTIIVGIHYRKLFSVVTLLQLLSLGFRHSSSLRLSLLSLLTNTLPGPRASEVTTLRRYTNMCIVFIIIIIIIRREGCCVSWRPRRGLTSILSAAAHRSTLP